jgi:hypothetical protein
MMKMSRGGYAAWMCTNELFFHPFLYATQKELDVWFHTHTEWSEEAIEIKPAFCPICGKKAVYHKGRILCKEVHI